jgi:hypothetical protein
MFSLLGDIRAHAKYRKVPILCVLGARGRFLTEIAIEGLDHAVNAMTANGFLDLHVARSGSKAAEEYLQERRKAAGA